MHTIRTPSLWVEFTLLVSSMLGLDLGVFQHLHLDTFAATGLRGCKSAAFHYLVCATGKAHKAATSGPLSFACGCNSV